ncbi:MAG: hypothetical protein ACJA1F_001874 [Paracoccaceae bacterium]|jgi:hypothetical protein
MGSYRIWSPQAGNVRDIPVSGAGRLVAQPVLFLVARGFFFLGQLVVPGVVAQPQLTW